MNRSKRIKASVFFLLITLVFINVKGYENFKVAVYARAYEVRQMNDLNWLTPIWDEISRQVHVDKIYLETHRDEIVVDKETMQTAINFFKSRGVKVAGGITLTINEGNMFETFCYSNPEHRQKVKEIVEHTASLFDELILDDFFFTNCKCNLCIEAKGDKSWTQYRLDLLTEVARNIIVGPAKAINPNIKVVIKYPNWYEHFQGCGFNLETEPKIFDGIYTGTETRDAVLSNQHLQQYHGYLIFRYFENIKPKGNGGGWVDTGGMRYLDRYAEQLWLTMFAKAPEITLFDFRQMRYEILDSYRAEWQGDQTSFDFDEMMKPLKLANGELVKPTTVARAAGYTFEKIDKFLGQLGNPVGVKSYRPYHSVGEDFLQTYLGMAGIPMDIVPEFPTEENMILLTETAKFDLEIVEKIKGQLKDGKNVMITSGLLKALEGNGIEDIVELRYTDRKAIVNEFKSGWVNIYKSDVDMIIPQIQYLTNDSWEIISGMDDGLGWPFIHMADYAKGKLYVLVIPENFANLYNLPVEVLTEIKKILTASLPVRLEAPGKVSLFLYDNNTLIVESFLDEEVNIKLVADKNFKTLTNINSGNVLNALEFPKVENRRMPREEDKIFFKSSLKPHSYKVFKMN
ncbi:MAG: hypothetical protein JXJ22_05440 [Bacteroidales bacterium]|nr:hypothetical protein [Bacteroidales bacterium]